MRTITLEEHFTTPKFLDGPGRKRKEQAEKVGGRLAKVFAQLVDVGRSGSRRWTPPVSTCRCCR